MVAVWQAHTKPTHPKPPVLINNAGVAARKPALDFTQAEVRQMFDVNYFGVVAMCDAVVPHMVARRAGRVFNVGSGLGYNTLPCMSHYGGEPGAEGVGGGEKGRARRLSDAAAGGEGQCRSQLAGTRGAKGFRAEHMILDPPAHESPPPPLPLPPQPPSMLCAPTPTSRGWSCAPLASKSATSRPGGSAG